MRTKRGATHPDLPDPLLNRALAVGIAAGEPAFSHPFLRNELARMFPSLSRAQLNEYNRLIKTIMQFGTAQLCDLVTTHEQTPSFEKFQQRLLAKYPWIDAANVQSLYSKALWVLYR